MSDNENLNVIEPDPKYHIAALESMLAKAAADLAAKDGYINQVLNSARELTKALGEVHQQVDALNTELTSVRAELEAIKAAKQ